jgi:hypothetical protein
MDNNHTQHPKWVSNEVANKVVASAQTSMRNGRHDSLAVRKLMDLVSGVKDYRMGDHRHQGLIKRIYNLERRSQYNYGGTTLSNNFGIDFDDVISAFWEAVFRKLPVAATTGDTVNVRIVAGQATATPVQHVGSINVAQRVTKCNPINYLKQHGWLGVRNMLNRSYRKHIAQVCDDCGHSSNVMSKEVNGENCPRCSSSETEKFWPSGHSSYRSKKARRCNGCKYVWSRHFVRTCSECGSDNVHTDALVMNNEESMMQQASEDETAEQTIITGQAQAELTALLDDIYKSLPRDPKDPTLVTHTHNVFELLTRPEASKEMCRLCVKAAPLVCSDKCKTPNCSHDKIPDPGVSCGAESMATATKCVNYSKKIAEYHNVSASLASRRVKKVRKYVAMYISKHRSYSTLDTVYELLTKRGVL